MEKQKRRRGDRDDGRLVRDLDSIHRFMPYVMPNRTDAEVYLNEPVDVTDLIEFLKEKNSSGGDHKYTLFHAAAYAVAKTLTLRPVLNRFIAGRRYYERDHVSLSFVAKHKFADDAQESLIIVRADKDMGFDEMSRLIAGDVKKSRDAGGNNLDNTLDFLVKMPRPLQKLFMATINRLDYYGKMPLSLRKMDPNFTSVLISNLGSIGLGAPYHHLNNYGTNSILFTIGKMYYKKILGGDGSENTRSFIDVGITLDERIGDGFYYSRSINLFKGIMNAPKEYSKTLGDDVDFEY